MTFLVPERLETGRLLLRQFADADWHGLHDYFGDAEATGFTWGRALSTGETWRTMCTMIGHWQLRGYGPYAVVDKSSDQVLGTVGFWYPNDWPEPEIKWGLARRYWGRGYASEAARAVLSAGHDYLPDITLISMIHDDNAASIGVAHALGAKRERAIDYEGEPHGVYRHLATPRQAIY
jgi:RimJ/RimL family protein N-acetyltransferase